MRRSARFPLSRRYATRYRVDAACVLTILAAALGACGGRTVSEGSGAGGAGQTSSGQGGNAGSAAGGASGGGGAADASPCDNIGCPDIGCAPGYMSVLDPGACCPVCRPIPCDGPCMPIACPSGTHLETPPGQC